MEAVEVRRSREMQDKEREIADRLTQATVDQIQHKFSHDMEILKSRTPTQEQQAREAALDAKYLADRQLQLVKAQSRALSFALTIFCEAISGYH